MQIKIKLKPGATMPAYQTEGAAGMDLHACISEPVRIPRFARHRIYTGVFLVIPPGFEGQIRARSGLAFNQGITMLSGTIDSDYRGEIAANLINLGESDWIVYPGDRIAQIVFAPIARATLVPADELETSERGANGFGSTGV